MFAHTSSCFPALPVLLLSGIIWASHIYSPISQKNFWLSWFLDDSIPVNAGVRTGAVSSRQWDQWYRAIRSHLILILNLSHVPSSIVHLSINTTFLLVRVYYQKSRKCQKHQWDKWQITNISMTVYVRSALVSWWIIIGYASGEPRTRTSTCFAQSYS